MRWIPDKQCSWLCGSERQSLQGMRVILRLLHGSVASVLLMQWDYFTLTIVDLSMLWQKAMDCDKVDR